MPQEVLPLVTALNVHDYFRDQLATSLHNQQIEVRESTAAYLANLLAGFLDPNQLFTRTPDGLELRPLALHYADAAYSEGSEQRNLALKRLGDVALFISGVFSGSLNRKLVDVDYYIAMGCAAYRDLHAFLAGRRFDDGFVDPFEELSRKFGALVDVLAEVSEESHLGSNNDVMRNYEIWLRTGSARALRKLQRLGLQPSRHATSRAHH